MGGAGVFPAAGAEARPWRRAHSLAELEVFIGKQVRVVTEPLCGQEQFDVVMM